MTEIIRVLIADDKELMRRGLGVLLGRTPDILCVGEASDGQQAIELGECLQPDVILMDINMPRLDGLQATAQITASHTNIRVLIVAMSHSDHLIRRAIECGVRGYVIKTDMYAELVPAIRAVHAGEMYFSSGIKLPPDVDKST